MAAALARLLTLLFLSAVLAGCATCPAPGAPDPAFQTFQARVPTGGFLVQQRVTMVALGREYPMLGTLAVAADGRWRLQASSELGGLMFDLLGATATARVLFKPDSMGEKPLREGLAGDIRALYLRGPAQGRRLTLSEGGFTLDDPLWHYRLQVRELKRVPGAPREAVFSDRPVSGTAGDDSEGEGN